MRGIRPWDMLSTELPAGVQRGGWCGKPWTGPSKDVHEVERVLFFVDPDLPKPRLIDLITEARARWEPHDVKVAFFEDRSSTCPALWSTDRDLLGMIGPDELARLWQVPREAVDALF